MIPPEENSAQSADVPPPTPAMEERARLKEYTERWKRLGPLLEALREEEVRRSDTLSNIAAFGRLYAIALASTPPLSTSGLV